MEKRLEKKDQKSRQYCAVTKGIQKNQERRAAGRIDCHFAVWGCYANNQYAITDHASRREKTRVSCTRSLNCKPPRDGNPLRLAVHPLSPPPTPTRALRLPCGMLAL